MFLFFELAGIVSHPLSIIPLFDNSVDKPVLAGFLGGQEVIAVGVMLDLLDCLTGALGIDAVHALTDLDYVIGMDLDVRRLTLESAEQRLVDHYLGVRESETLALGAGREQE